MSSPDRRKPQGFEPGPSKDQFYSSHDLGLQLSQSRSNLPREYQKAIVASRKLAKELRDSNYGTIHALGVELYHKRGLVRHPMEFCITVLVGIKSPSPAVRNRVALDRFAKRKKYVRAIPRSYNGFPVKVLEGQPRFATPTPLPATSIADGDASIPPDNVVRQGGAAISGVDSQKWGTLGIVFEDLDGKKLGITCEHVLRDGPFQQPPFVPHVLPRVAGDVRTSRNIPNRGIDAALLDLQSDFIDGILDINSLEMPISIFFDEPERPSYWSWLIQSSVWIRGAATGRVVQGKISMPSVHHVSLNGKLFQDLIAIHSSPASSQIVQHGDSGAAVLLQRDGRWIWIGIVVAMVSPQHLLACKLPACFRQLGLDRERLAPNQLWRLE